MFNERLPIFVTTLSINIPIISYCQIQILSGWLFWPTAFDAIFSEPELPMLLMWQSAGKLPRATPVLESQEKTEHGPAQVALQKCTAKPAQQRTQRTQISTFDRKVYQSHVVMFSETERYIIQYHSLPNPQIPQNTSKILCSSTRPTFQSLLFVEVGQNPGEHPKILENIWTYFGLPFSSPKQTRNSFSPTSAPHHFTQTTPRLVDLPLTAPRLLVDHLPCRFFKSKCMS